MMDIHDWLEEYGTESGEVLRKALCDNKGKLATLVDMVCESLRNNRKTIFFGNGGSAADAQHLAAEFVNRYMFNRPELAGLALTTDTSVITSISNDFGYDFLFAKQLRALALPGDVALGISTSGKSKNVLLGLEAAREARCVTVGFCGNNSAAMKSCCDVVLKVDSPSTPMVQQAHITMGHALCHLVEEKMFPRE